MSHSRGQTAYCHHANTCFVAYIDLYDKIHYYKTICTVMSSERIEDWIQCITRGHRAHEECTDVGTRNLSLNVPTANLTYGRQNENISCCLVKFNF